MEVAFSLIEASEHTSRNRFYERQVSVYNVKQLPVFQYEEYLSACRAQQRENYAQLMLCGILATDKQYKAPLFIYRIFKYRSRSGVTIMFFSFSCQVIRRCDINAVKWSYLCPNGTVSFWRHQD